MTLGLLVLLKVIRIKIPIDFQYDLSLEARKKWELRCDHFGYFAPHSKMRWKI